MTTRRIASLSLAGMALAASLCTALPAMAIGRLADVQIVNRDSGEVLRMYQHKGEYWVVGEPGARAQRAPASTICRSLRLLVTM